MARAKKLQTSIDAYLEALAIAGRSPWTIATYRSRLLGFASFAADRRVTTIGRITADVIDAYLAHLHDAGLHGKTRQTAQSILRRWCEWMVKQRWIDSSPMPFTRAKRREPGIPRAVLTADEVERVLDAIDVSIPAGLRDRAMIEVLYSSGLRRAELAALRLTDVDVERGLLFIRRGKGNKDRIIPIGDRALFWIDRYVTEVRPRHVPGKDPGNVFMSRQRAPLCAAMITTRIKLAVQRAGLVKAATPHSLRHTAATVLMEGGADTRYVQELLGHKDISTTANYTRVTIEHLKKAHARTHPLAR
jgi:integrase/recombinase XerD